MSTLKVKLQLSELTKNTEQALPYPTHTYIHTYIHNLTKQNADTNAHPLSHRYITDSTANHDTHNYSKPNKKKKYGQQEKLLKRLLLAPLKMTLRIDEGY